MAANVTLPEVADPAPQTAPAYEASEVSFAPGDTTVDDAIFAVGLPPASIEGAIVVGSRGGRALQALSKRLPALRNVLILEPDPRSRSTLDRDRESLELTIDPGRCSTIDVSRGSVSEETLCVDVARFLLDHRLSLRGCVTMATSVQPQHLRITRQLFALVSRIVWRTELSVLDLLDRRTARDGPVPPTTDRFLRRWAEFLFEQGELYGALLVYLRVYRWSSDLAIARRIAAAFAGLGAPRQALAWLDRTDLPPAALEATRQELVQAMASLLPDQDLLLAANLEVLAKRCPDSARAVETASDDGLVTLWLEHRAWVLDLDEGPARAAVRPYPLLARLDGDLRLLPQNFPDPPIEFLRHRLSLHRLPDRHVLIGSLARYDALVNVLAQPSVTHAPNWKTVTRILEEEPAIAKGVMRAVDLRPFLGPDLVDHVVVGAGSEAAYVQGLREDTTLPLPRVGMGLSSELADALKQVDRDRLQTMQRFHEAIHGLYDESFPVRLLEKIDRGAPLRVWLWTSIYSTVVQYVTNDLAAGFRALGHEVEVLIESARGHWIDAASVAESVARFQPDLVVLLDHGRPEFGRLFPPNLPLVCWIIDELPALSRPEFVSRIGTLDLFFAFDHPVVERLLGLGYPSCELLPFGVRTDLDHGSAAVEPAPVVAHTTHLSHYSELACAPGLLAHIERKLAAMPTRAPDLEPILKEAIEETGVQVPDEAWQDLRYQVILVARHVERVRLADAVLDAGLSLAVFGHGWDEIARFRPYARGVAKAGAEVLAVYREHKVVLHMGCIPHPRILETIAAGGFVLAHASRDRDVVPGGPDDQLILGEELCVYFDLDDMIQKIERALHDEPWRQSFIQKGRARVMADHSYQRRAAQILEALHRRLRRVVYEGPSRSGSSETSTMLAAG